MSLGSCGIDSFLLQNGIGAAICHSQGWLTVVVMIPVELLPIVAFGCPEWGWLNPLKASNRSSRWMRSLIGKFWNKD